jgi:hypothetical protein
MPLPFVVALYTTLAAEPTCQTRFRPGHNNCIAVCGGDILVSVESARERMVRDDATVSH